MVLTGALSKMGVYGFIRLLLPLFPNEVHVLGPWLLGLAVCSIIFSSLAAWAQTDLKRMMAYLSINHLGYCMLGLFAVTATTAVPAVEAQAGIERSLPAKRQSRPDRGRAVLLCRSARTAARDARAGRLRRPHATQSISCGDNVCCWISTWHLFTASPPEI